MDDLQNWARNDTRVRGAGPSRKPFVRLKTCPAPHPLQPIVRPRIGSAVLEEFGYGETDVSGDSAQQNGRDVAPNMERNGGCPAVRVPELLMGALLAHLLETEVLQNAGNLPWL